MKTLLATGLILFSLSNLASATELLCASKKDQDLYYSNGQVLITAKASSPTLLTNFTMEMKGSNLGSSENRIRGKATNNWVRFQFADAWCDYSAALPKNFTSLETFTLFLDAHCEENTNGSVRLNCRLK